MKNPRLLSTLSLALFVAVAVPGRGQVRRTIPPGPDQASSLAIHPSALLPGLQLVIQRVVFAPPLVRVIFRISAESGQGLDRLGIATVGAVNAGFVLARIKSGDTHYSSYITKTESNKDRSVQRNVPAPDTGGTYTALGDGVYRYTFGLQLPSPPEMDAIHTVGIFASRDLTPLGMSRPVANATYDFVPSGVAVTHVRDIVRTDNCNQCHDPLAKHDGERREVRLCILCHQPQNVDAETGNTRDFKVMIHKIHRGANLPSVKAGKPFRIMDGKGSVNDFSTVVLPQDIRNCTTCHQKASQADNHLTNPNQAACGACHDDVDFASGKNHPGGIQPDDTKCKTCHVADSGKEFDLSVKGAHTIPEYSKQLKGLNIKILGVDNTNPGDHLTVSFTATDDAGEVVEVSRLDVMTLVLAGPVANYTWRADSDGRQALLESGAYRHTFPTALPTEATGTFAVSARAVRNLTLKAALPGKMIEAQESALNPVLYFGIGGSKAVPRRIVIDANKCQQCHKDLSIGRRGLRRNPEYCVLCHNRKFTDVRSRPADQGPVETLNFTTMVHRIHMGRKLSQEYKTYATSRVSNWADNRFPGDQRNCAKCHVGDSHTLPLPEGPSAVDAPRFYYSPMGPAAAACLGCHNSKSDAAHAYQMTAPFGEGCAACHKEGALAAVSKVHAR